MTPTTGLAKRLKYLEDKELVSSLVPLAVNHVAGAREALERLAEKGNPAAREALVRLENPGTAANTTKVNYPLTDDRPHVPSAPRSIPTNLPYPPHASVLADDEPDEPEPPNVRPFPRPSKRHTKVGTPDPKPLLALVNGNHDDRRFALGLAFGRDRHGLLGQRRQHRLQPARATLHCGPQFRARRLEAGSSNCALKRTQEAPSPR